MKNTHVVIIALLVVVIPVALFLSIRPTCWSVAAPGPNDPPSPRFTDSGCSRLMTLKYFFRLETVEPSVFPPENPRISLDTETGNQQPKTILSREELQRNCAMDVSGKGIDDLGLDSMTNVTKTVTLSWWDNTIEDNAKLQVLFDPESNFAGCSESVKRLLNSIKESYEEEFPNMTWDEIYAEYEPIEKTDASFKTYTDGNLSFQYPKEWEKVSEFEFNTRRGNLPKDQTNTDVMYLLPPDAVISRGEWTGSYMTARFAIEVRSLNAHGETFATAVANAESDMKEIPGRFEVLKVDGRDAILSDQNWDGSILHATIFDGDIKYSFQLFPANEKEMIAGWSRLKSLLATVKIK